MIKARLMPLGLQRNTYSGCYAVTGNDQSVEVSGPDSVAARLQAVPVNRKKLMSCEGVCLVYSIPSYTTPDE